MPTFRPFLGSEQSVHALVDSSSGILQRQAREHPTGYVWHDPDVQGDI